MLIFDENFFLGEVREGFYVEPMMKCAWAAEMEVLQTIHGICEKHNLQYFAYAGTLLGAARHKGYVPWDDDLDICMLRSDYNRFLQIARTELPADFQLRSPYTDESRSESFTHIRNAGTIDTSPERLQSFHGCPYVVGVDIYPLDALPADPSEESIICTLYSTFLAASRQVDTDLPLVMESLPELEEMCRIKFDLSGNLKNQLLRAADKVCQLFDISECCSVTCVPDHAYSPIPFLKEWFNEIVWLPFENISLPAPKNYDAILRILYGDWHIPVKGTAYHDYPFYKSQEKLYKETIMKSLKEKRS